MSQIEAHADVHVNKILIGNKCDVPDEQRVVSTEQGKALAEEFGISFFECSAKANLHVDDSFTALVRARRKLAQGFPCAVMPTL